MRRFARLKSAAAVIPLLASLGTLSCSDPASPSERRLPLSMGTSALSLVVKGEYQLNIYGALPGETIVWSSSDTRIVTVDNAGFATGRAIGTARIEATNGHSTASIIVDVKAAALRFISNVPDGSIVVGDSVTVRVEQLDGVGEVIQDAPGQVVWTTTVPTVALVTSESDPQSRTVRGVAVGVASILANANGATGWFFVRVYPRDGSAIPVASVTSFVIEEYVDPTGATYIPLIDVVASEPLELYRIDFNVPGTSRPYSFCGNISLDAGKAYALFEDDMYGTGWSGSRIAPVNQTDAMLWFRNASGKVSVVAARAPITKPTNPTSSAEQLYYAWNICVH